jgi:hypothetical protein
VQLELFYSSQSMTSFLFGQSKPCSVSQKIAAFPQGRAVVVHVLRTVRDEHDEYPRYLLPL